MSLANVCDIHVHILPGLDDGARTLDEAKAMAAAAEQKGTSIIVATPHVDLSRSCPVGNPAPTARTIREAVAVLQDELLSSRIPVQVLPGMELAVDPEIVHFVEQDQALTIADAGKHVLVELPFEQLPAYVDQIMFDLSSSGYVPVIAHPERNATIAEDPNRLYSMVRAGALAQVNAGSLLGKSGRKVQRTAEVLLAHGLAHVIASDGHSLNSRPCRLDQAFAAASKAIGERMAVRAMIDVPRSIVLGEDVVLDEPEEYAPRRHFSFRVGGFLSRRLHRSD